METAGTTVKPSKKRSGMKKLENKFILPEISHGSANFVLTNGAKLTNFKWIGVYDSCEKVSKKIFV